MSPRIIPYPAAVNAVWLCEGDIVAAAELLRTDLMSVANAIGDDPDRSTNAFCGRDQRWEPEHSLGHLLEEKTAHHIAALVLKKIQSVHSGATWVGDIYDITKIIHQGIRPDLYPRPELTITSLPRSGPTPENCIDVYNTSIRRAGAEAFAAGVDYSDNPWDRGTPERELWLYGHLNAGQYTEIPPGE